MTKKNKENNQINETINELKKKIMILEWDKEKNQLNPGKNTYLKKIKEKVNELENEIKNSKEKKGENNE